MEGKRNSSGSYRPVEAIGKGLNVLEALGYIGWATVGELSAQTGIQRSSLYRIVETLIGLGYVLRREDDGKVALTYKVRQLGEGLREDDIVAQTLAPHMKTLTRKILWPSDFASFSLGAVRIRHSTHKISPMSVHSRMVGRERSLTRSALGKTILSEMSPSQITQVKAILSDSTSVEAKDLANPYWLTQIVETVRGQGYASSVGQTEDQISAIALPVKSGDMLLGAINIIFFRSAMTPAEAAERYLDALRQCCEEAGADVAALKAE